MTKKQLQKAKAIRESASAVHEGWQIICCRRHKASTRHSKTSLEVCARITKSSRRFRCSMVSSTWRSPLTRSSLLP